MPEGSRFGPIRWLQRPYRFLKYGYWEPRYSDISRFLSARFSARNDLIIVQVGANDGVKNDGVRPWLLSGRYSRAILVEPSPFAFAMLESSSGHLPNVELVNVAISSCSGKMDFYEVGETDDWVDSRFCSRLSSFDREVIRKQHFYRPEYEQFIRAISVDVVTLRELCSSRDIKKIDYLYIDAEGHDFEILKSIEGIDVDISVIQYEWVNLTRSDILNSFAVLRKMGFSLAQEGRDVIAAK